MKININKVIFIILCGISIGLCSFAFSVSLLTDNRLLQYSLLSLDIISGIMFVNARRKYPLYIKKSM